MDDVCRLSKYTNKTISRFFETCAESGIYIKTAIISLPEGPRGALAAALGCSILKRSCFCSAQKVLNSRVDILDMMAR